MLAISRFQRDFFESMPEIRTVGQAEFVPLAGQTLTAGKLCCTDLKAKEALEASALDRGNLAPLPRLALMMRAEVAALRGMILEDFIRRPGRAGPPPPHCRAVCPYCLAGDIEQGRAPYVRRTWTHPLAVYCGFHRAPLGPHGNSDIKIASELTLFGRLQPYEPRDNLLDLSHFDATELIQHTIDVIEDSTKETERAILTDAVSDIVDALATNMYTPNSGAAIRLIETPIMRRRSLPGSNEIPEKWWLDVNARERLLYVRMAFLFLRESTQSCVGIYSYYSAMIANSVYERIQRLMSQKG